MPKKRNHPDYYYAMRDEILALMDGQAGQPLNETLYRKHFRTVAAKHAIPPQSYLAHFNIIKSMVAKAIRTRKPRQAILV